MKRLLKNYDGHTRARKLTMCVYCFPDLNDKSRKWQTVGHRYFKCTLIVPRLKSDLRVEPERLGGLDRPIKSAGYHLNANKFVRPLRPNRTPPRRGVGKVFKLKKLLITFRPRGFDYERYLFFYFYAQTYITWLHVVRIIAINRKKNFIHYGNK